jgi:hypothetical protein
MAPTSIKGVAASCSALQHAQELQNVVQVDDLEHGSFGFDNDRDGHGALLHRFADAVDARGAEAIILARRASSKRPVTGPQRGRTAETWQTLEQPVSPRLLHRHPNSDV